MSYTNSKKSTGLETLDDTTVANGDLVVVGDVSDSGRAKAITWTSVKAFLKTYLDTLYPSGSGTSTGTNTGNETTTTEGALINGATAKTTPVDADYVGLMDSAASNVLKKLSWANIKATLKTYFDTQYSNGVFKSGVTTYDVSTTSGTQTIAHGLGITPKRVTIKSAMVSATTLDSNSYGVFDSSGNRCLYNILETDDTTSGNLVGTSTSYAILASIDSTDLDDSVTGVILVDSTNITITWTKTGSPTGTLYLLWEAE